MMFVEPVEGRRVRDPRTLRVIKGPYAVNDFDPYFLRLLRDGDVRVVAGPSADEAPAASSTDHR